MKADVNEISWSASEKSLFILRTMKPPDSLNERLYMLSDVVSFIILKSSIMPLISRMRRFPKSIPSALAVADLLNNLNEPFLISV